MDKDELKEKLLDLWSKFKEACGRIWEEIVDRTLDLWDSFKRLPKNAQLGIAVGLGVVVLLAIAVPLLYTPTLPLIAVQNTAGLTGEGNWIAIKNTSDRPLTRLNVIMDDRYIYYIERIDPGEQVKILNRDFYIRLEGNKFGEKVSQDLVGQKLLILSRQGKVKLLLVEKKRGLFGG